MLPTQEKEALFYPPAAEISYCLRDLRTGQDIKQLKSTQPYVAASVAKVYLAGTAFHLAQRQELDLEEKVKITPDDFLNGNYGDGILRWQYAFSGRLATRLELPWLLPEIHLQELICRMVRDSDNLATLAAVNHIGRNRIQEVLRTWGMFDTTVYNPHLQTNNVTTATDTCYYLDNLANNKLIDPERGELLMELLHKNTQLTRKLRLAQTLYKDGATSTLGDEGVELSYFNLAGYIKPVPYLPPTHCFAIFTRDRAIYNRKGTTPRQFMSAQDKLHDFVNLVA